MGLDNRDPRPGEIARVGGHRRQPVLNPAMHKASDAGHWTAWHAADPPPEGQKRLIFEECSMCIKHRKYRQKWPLGGASLGQGAEPPKS